jgi:H+/Cl- antiporter ClcA
LVGAVSGVVSGVGAYVFLEGLDRVTTFRLDHREIVWGLPLAGAALGLVWSRAGGRATGGTALVVDVTRRGGPRLPLRLAPLAIAGTWVAHLFGASVGREGVGLQVAGALTDATLRRTDESTRRIALVASLAAGFAAVFGVPAAGAVFALEIAGPRRRSLPVVVAVAVAAGTGHLVVSGLGHHHGSWPQLRLSLSALDLLRLLLLGVAMALTGRLFHWAVRRVRALGARRSRWLRASVGGVAVLLGALVFGRDYLGLSVPLAVTAVAGVNTSWWRGFIKIGFTAVSLGAGFPGGEVTPLFVIGATTAAAVSSAIGLNVSAGAAVGFVTVFASVAAVPVTGVVLAVELFGWAMFWPVVMATLSARMFRGRHGLYDISDQGRERNEG